MNVRSWKICLRGEFWKDDEPNREKLDAASSARSVVVSACVIIYGTNYCDLFLVTSF